MLQSKMADRDKSDYKDYNANFERGFIMLKHVKSLSQHSVLLSYNLKLRPETANSAIRARSRDILTFTVKMSLF